MAIPHQGDGTCSPRSLTAPASADQGRPASRPTPASTSSAWSTGYAGLVATEFSYRKDEEIYGEDEPAEYVYQVIRGAVRTYKLLNDGRRQIGAFHLPGDVFGLDSGAVPSAHGRSHHRHHRAPGEAPQPRSSRRLDVKVAHNLWTMTAGDLRHAEDHMLLLGRKTAMEKVATFLLEMDRRLAMAGMMALPMCRRDIGDYLGLTLETVSRALSQLRTRACWDFPAPARSCCATASGCQTWTPERYR